MVSYRRSIVTTAQLLVPVCGRMSPTFKSIRKGQFGAKFWDERVDECKPNFNAICERHGVVL